MLTDDEAIFKKLVPVYMKLGRNPLQDEVYEEYARLRSYGLLDGAALQDALAKSGLIEIAPKMAQGAEEYDEIMAGQEVMERL